MFRSTQFLTLFPFVTRTFKSQRKVCKYLRGFLVVSRGDSSSRSATNQTEKSIQLHSKSCQTYSRINGFSKKELNLLNLFVSNVAAATFSFNSHIFRKCLHILIVFLNTRELVFK